MLTPIALLSFGVAAFLGVLFVQARARVSLAALQAQLDASRETLARTEAARAQAERALAEQARRNAELTEAKAFAEARGMQVGRLEDEVEALDQALAVARETESSLRERLKHIEATLETERRAWEEKLATVKNAREELSSQFKALASEALSANNQSFLELAQENLKSFGETAKGDLAQRQTAFEELVKPVRDTLEKLGEHVQKSDKDREGAYHALLSQVKSLGEGQELSRTETSKLVQALRNPNVRGQWGEVQLRRVVELSGLSEGVSFVEQETYDSGDRSGRPDLIVKLPNRRSIVVDAKVPLTGYLEAMNAPDEATRTRSLKSHAAALTAKIDDLAKKDYPSLVEGAVELVVLFLPAEGFARAAFDADPDLIERALEKGVVVATPMTLMGLLRAAAYGWRQEAIARNAEKVSELGAQLHERLITMTEHFAKVGKGLENATAAYNQVLSSYDKRVLPAARKLEELKAGRPGKEFPELKPVDERPRLLVAREEPAQLAAML
jgi:DNA recombination protein RmuC